MVNYMCYKKKKLSSCPIENVYRSDVSHSNNNDHAVDCTNNHNDFKNNKNNNYNKNNNVDDGRCRLMSTRSGNDAKPILHRPRRVVGSAAILL